MTEEKRFGSAEWIQEILPHRYPILLVDRVVEIEPKKRIVAYKSVSQNESFFQGHFPGHPVMPGVLVIEGIAQAAGILLLHDDPERERKLIYFTGIDKAKFRRPIVPGDRLTYEIEVDRYRSVHSRFRGRATVEGELAVEVICSSMVFDR